MQLGRPMEPAPVMQIGNQVREMGPASMQIGRNIAAIHPAMAAQDSILRDIPVVIVSGNVQSDEPLEGICAYLRKPVNVDRLIDLIDHHC